MTALDDLAPRWPEISALLDEVLELPASQRANWVDTLDGERAALKDTVRRLLEARASIETGDFLDTLPRLKHALEAADDAMAAKPGALVGPYRLISELGHGGMGAVWLADRADGSLKRQVALKLPHVTWAGGLAERMGRERDILATLEHPNIARLYDAGVDSMGRPWLALEYVQGRTIDVFARECALDVRARVDLLLQVCSAVAYAHSRLVIHRDLKPSNILVTDEGQVRLLDFGIAKLVQGEHTEETALTREAGRALTLDYASPEQVRGAPLGTSSDVYSLGVVAYELLSGEPPYKLERGTAAQMEQAIASAQPALASVAAPATATKKLLRGDLDAILNASLKKEPQERYATVVALAEDLGRHMSGRPVLAQPDSAAYRLRKFVRRHRVGVAASTALLVTAALGTALSVWQALEARAQTSLAEQATDRQQAVLNLYIEAMTNLSAKASNDAKTLANPRAATIELEATLREMEPRYAARPAEKAALLEAVMLQLNYTNDFQGSLVVGQRYLEHLKANRAAPERIIHAHTALGRTLFQLGRRDESLAMRRAGFVWAPDAQDERTQITRLSLGSDLANLLLRRGERREAEQVLLRGETVASRLFPNHLVRFENLKALVGFHLGFDDPLALRYARQAVDGQRANGTASQDLRADSLLTLGHALAALGQSAAAEAAYREAHGLFISTNGRANPNTARTLGRLTMAMAHQGRHAEVRELLEREVAALGNADDPRARGALLTLRAHQLQNEVLSGDLAAAAPWLDADVSELISQPFVRDAYVYLTWQARGLTAIGRGAEALAHIQTAHRAWPERSKPAVPWMRLCGALAEAQLAQGQHAAARDTAAALARLLEGEGARSSWLYRWAGELAALAAARLGDESMARRWLADLDGVQPQPVPPSDFDRAESLRRRSEVAVMLAHATQAQAKAR